MSKYKLLYVLSPLVSVALAAKGYPVTYIALGVAISLGLVLLDTFEVARRMLDVTGSGRAAGHFLLQMAQPVLAMFIPATIWNAAGFGIGWIISQFIT